MFQVLINNSSVGVLATGVAKLMRVQQIGHQWGLTSGSRQHALPDQANAPCCCRWFGWRIMQIIRTCENVRDVICALAGAITILQTPTLPLSGTTELPLSRDVPERHRQFLGGLAVSSTPVHGLPDATDELEEHTFSIDAEDEIQQEVVEMDKHSGAYDPEHDQDSDSPVSMCDGG
jgi:hypothetical protein